LFPFSIIFEPVQIILDLCGNSSYLLFEHVQNNSEWRFNMYQETYYVAYISLCAAVILWLGWTLHRTGSVFLTDAFAGNVALVRAVAHLLDVGFYLVSVGYVTVSYQITWEQMNSYAKVAQVVSGKVGGFLLLLGFAHLFNLLLLAIFRRRAAGTNSAAAA
jgi:hypothetical protein